MQHTQNYQLSRWEKDDRIMMEDFNADNETIDAALKANADAVGALQTGKADAAALSEETSARTAADSSFAGQLAELAANLGVRGHNCRIATGSYVGKGTYGESNPTKISCDFYPVIVIIAYETAASELNNCKFYSVHYLRGMSYGATVAPSTTMAALTWTNQSVSFYSSSAGNQANYNGYTYHYFILGYDKTAEAAAE